MRSNAAALVQISTGVAVVSVCDCVMGWRYDDFNSYKSSKMPVDTKKPAKKLVAKSAAAKSTSVKSTLKSNGKPQVLSKGTKILSANLKPLEALAEVPSTDAAPNPELPTEWEAEEFTWAKLRVDRYKRAWVLAALSVGAKPFKNLRKRLKNAGQTEKLNAYVIARSAALNNLTSTNDSTRLQYVKDAENDGRLINPAAKATERMVDVLRFVKFMDSRGLPVHDRMRAIAAEFGGGSETHNRPSDSNGMTHTTEPLAGSREMLAMALLMMYVKHLAQTKTTPPQKLLKGQGNLKLSELASEIHQFAEGRTDQVTANVLASTGASPETLRKGLAAAQKFFHDTFVD